MVEFLKNLFSAALKTNDSLEKGILTGCLRIAKESIFTGLNNFSVFSIFTKTASDCFGFTYKEVDELLDYYSLLENKDKIMEWYDGYLFGNVEIYNPWSALYYMKELLADPSAEPTSFWANTSSNDIVYNYIKKSDQHMRIDFDTLSSGGFIRKYIKNELTYREMDDISNIYSFLLFTGYLKIKKQLDMNTYELMIPNKEISLIYMNVFNEWFEDIINNNHHDFTVALMEKDERKARIILNNILFQSISYYDGKEDFYHGFLIGMLQGNMVKSNRESGNGRFDIAVIPSDFDSRGLLIECKKVDSLYELKKASEEAVEQIVSKKYLEEFEMNGYTDFVGYGIAFYKKQCFISRLR